MLIERKVSCWFPVVLVWVFVFRIKACSVGLLYDGELFEEPDEPPPPPPRPGKGAVFFDFDGTLTVPIRIERFDNEFATYAASQGS